MPAMGLRSERALLLQRILIGLLALLAVATLLSVILQGRDALAPQELTMNIVIALALVAGLWMLNRGRLRSVIWLEASVLMLTAVQGLRNGIEGNETALLIFVAPITMVGLLVGRLGLYLISLLSIAVVATVYVLEQVGSPLIVPMEDAVGPIGSVAFFAVVVGLLVLFLDRFALTLEDALARSTEREEALRQEVLERTRLETRLQLATEAAQIGLWHWEPGTEEVHWSPKMKELFGLEPTARVTLDTFYERITDEDRERVRRNTENAGEGGENSSDPFRILLPDGRVRWLMGSGKLLEKPGGGTEMLGAVYDVTALLQAETERAQMFDREQEARQQAERVGERLAFLADASHILADSLNYRQTLSQVAGLVVPRLADWCAIDVLNSENELERVVVMHSDPQKVRLAHELQRLYPARPDADGGAYQVLRTGEPVLLPEVRSEMLEQVARDDQHLELLRNVGFHSVIMAPLISRGTPLGVLILVHAESNRQYAAEDLDLAMQLAERAAIAVDNARLYGEARALNSELEERVQARTQELQAANAELESFTYSASHDLRAPLRGINGFSQALLDDYGDKLDDTAREYLNRIQTGAMRMGELIDDLLDLSRISRTGIHDQPVDLSALVEQIAEELRQQHPERSVELSVEPGLSVCADPGLLRIALENLLGNAWKFTDRREQAHVEVAFDRSKGAYFVRDDGAGFSMAYANKLFVPFQRLHPAEAYSGTGIGLATTKRIIDRHGGSLWGEGEEGKGAVFYFTLPPAESDGQGD